MFRYSALRECILPSSLGCADASQNYSARHDLAQKKSATEQKVMNKIFGIGLPRTGTTSLSKALRALGYEGQNYCLLHDTRTSDRTTFFEVDNSFYRNFKDIFHGNKNSKFILTTRDRDSWRKSISRFLENSNLLNYKNELPDISEYTEEVERFFKNHGSENQLLTFDVFDESCNSSCKWKKLSDFLKIEITGKDLPFPHTNLLSSQDFRLPENSTKSLGV